MKNQIHGAYIHTTKSHPDVLGKFLEMGHAAEWIHEQNRGVYILHLYLFQEITGSLPHNDDNVEVRDNVTIAYIYIEIMVDR